MMTRTKQRDTGQIQSTTKEVVNEPQRGWFVRFLGIATVLAIIVLATHWQALAGQAIFLDDEQYLTDNPLVLNPSWPAADQFLREVFRPSTVKGYYQPLSMISLMIDTALGGSPKHLRVYHRTSLALHVCNSVLVMLLLYQLFGHVWPAALMALLFGVHPLTVEPIPWLGERKTLLASFFALISLIAYVRYAGISKLRTPHSRQGEALGRSTAPLRTCYVLSILFYLLALMSKPTTTPLPLVMLLLDYWPLRRLSRKAIIEKIPLLLICVVFAFITFISQRETAGVQLPSQRGPAHIPLILCHNIVFYLWKLIWPMNLTPYYAFPEPFSLSHPRIIAGLIGTLFIFAGLAISFRYTVAVLTGWLIFFVTIFPTLGVIGFTMVIASDKYMYLPMLGFLLIGAWGWQNLWARTRTIQSRTFLITISLLIATAEIRLTRQQHGHWQNTDELFAYVLSKASTAHLQNNIGMQLVDKGKDEEAMKHLEMALSIQPDYPEAHNNIAMQLLKAGKIDDALTQCRLSIKYRNNYWEAHHNLAMILTKKGETAEAINSYKEALRYNPDYANAHYNLAILLLQQGQTQQATDHLLAAIHLNPNYAEAHNNLGMLLADQGNIEEAMKHYQMALVSQPNSAEAHNNLAILLLKAGKVDDAIAECRLALKNRYNFPEAHQNLAACLSKKGEFDKAFLSYEEALRLKPDYPNAHYNLANLLAEHGREQQAVDHFLAALRLKPDYAEAHNELGVILARRGQLGEAESHYREAARSKPTWLDPWYNLATTLIMENKLDEAITVYQDILRTHPQEADARTSLEELHRRKGQKPEAK